LLREGIAIAMYKRETDQAWGMLADVGEEERRTKMLQRYTELAAVPEVERVSRLLLMADAEYELPVDKLRTFTVSRLNVWLMLEPEVARRISVAKEFPRAEQERLVALIPAVFGGVELAKPAPAKKRWWPFGKR
jgi:hypothetical protein